MSLNSGLRKLTSRVVNKLTGEVTIRQITNGAYDASTGTVSESNTDVTIKGLIQNINNNEVNDLIQAEDKKVTIAAKDLTFTPSPKDKVVISSVIYQIVRVVTEEQENTAIYYELFLRS
jgi:hypothetical protein